MTNRILPIANRRGFTLVEMIIYIAIVSVILVSISYLMIDIAGGQIKSEARLEVNYNLRLISQRLLADIHSAQNISSLAPDTLVLAGPGGTVTYNFDATNFELTRQVASNPAVVLNTKAVEISGSFSDRSFLGRTKNVSVQLTVSYKNPGNLPDYQASESLNFAAELRGRR